jgi:putative membrane protein insertion efficiency factor
MVKRLALNAIKLFQATRVFRSPCCRFWPSCSDYAYVSIERHGLLAGAWLALGRLLRCHPLHPGGVDLVPEK